MTIQRTLPAGVRREADREASAEQFFVFLTISHPTLSDPIPVVSNTVDCILDGVTYTAFQFSISILTDDERAPYAQLSIQNVDRSIGDALRNIDAPARIKMEVIAGSEFDQTLDPHIEFGKAVRTYTADYLYLLNVDVDAMFITGRLQTWDYAKETWPGTMTTQEAFPGLFR